MERQREANTRGVSREGSDAGHDADGGDGDVSGREGEPSGIGHRSERREDGGVVVQGLAHAHEDHVSNPGAGGGGGGDGVGRGGTFVFGREEEAVGVRQLLEDLSAGQVAELAEGACGAEGASHLAPDL